jgi:hypothetical protein
MATDPQSLLDQARCLECVGSSEYTLDLMEVVLLAKWANKGGAAPGCIPPGVMTLNSLGHGQTFVGLDYNPPTPPPTVGVIVKWGTVMGGPYPNTKNFPVGTPYTLMAGDGIVSSQTYFGVVFSDNGNGCVSAPSVEWSVTTDQSDLNAEWQARVTAAGGGNASNNTYRANDAFVAALAAAGITAKVKIANLFVPDSVPAASTPLIQGPGAATWTNPGVAFVAGDLTINGIINPVAGTKSFDIGVVPSNFMTAATNSGFIYVSQDDILQSEAEFGAGDGTGLNDFVLNAHWTDNHTYAYDYAQANFLDTGILNAGALLGYFCLSRTTANRADLYYANSTNAHASKANNAVANANVPTAAQHLFVFAWNSNGALIQRSQKRLSAAGFGTGLTAADSQALFNAIQAFRQKIGGGFA